jgi:hypothetical protein
MTYNTDRTGQGRWTPAARGSIGILWTNDTDSIGFLPIPRIDATPVQALIDNAYAAGKTATQAFDETAPFVAPLVNGTPIVKTGDIDNWREDRRGLSRPIRQATP